MGHQALELEFKTGLLKKARCPRAEAQGLVGAYQQRGVAITRLLAWSKLQSSSYYYKTSGGSKGTPPSTHSVNGDGELFENEVVINDIEATLQQEFCCYGYRNRTGELKERGWMINHKKVYRLMKEHKLLFGGRIRPEAFKRDFIRLRSPGAERPLQYLSMDIK